MTDIARAVDARDTLGESCIWCPSTRKVWWVDIPRPCLQSFDPRTGEHRVYPLPGRFCGNAALRKSGGFVLAMDNGLHGFDPASSTLELLLHVEPDQPENRYNDGRCDRRGRLWIGTMDIEIRRPSGSFYRIEPDGAAQRVLGGISVPNSTAFSPDDRTLYFADSRQRAIWAFDFDLAAGTIGNRRVFVELSESHGSPDGSCVDADGFLWNAEFAGGRIVRYAPDGRTDRVVELPVTCPTCCCFGGDALDTLYITTSTHRLTPEQKAAERFSGGLLAISNVGARGLSEAAFAG